MDRRPYQIEFLGAFFIWSINRFKGKLSDHYSKGSARKQIMNFLLGFLIIVFFTIVLAILMQ